ncbi:UDPglucose 6-dehydrogenase [Mesorhizobium albiziae]|uniref:UDP-glucose 6-dehydrogenase n=1 Tax=Neomesorhizobium albiziae TaxID=335020 RepID=A0A1I3YZM2_9HYPH|nr:UDP-glucose/GDP-mannose dehydrogenase family protein [Mesorhizobium albiziae]GLS33197.1 UDP-glucose 6-dehydrogenase [Mesorhizobium albiziae]SFK36799.1 UDPglucose 6-dehydrogenase [Mesorhizobium albiziae]
MKLTIFGTGYVGLVTAACFADVGHEVFCVDIDATRIGTLQRGEVPIFEPGLKELVVRNAEAGRLVFSTDARAGVQFAELIFIAVGTPPNGDGSADLRHVLDVARTIGEHIDGYKIVVGKSTVPVGTADRVGATITETMAARGVAHVFDVCSNPEFLKEGSAVEDFTKPARIIVGTGSEIVRKKLHDCYAPYNRNHDKLMYMDVRSAELTKYAANAMLATKISFMNEMANIAERLGADIEEVRKGIGSDPRIGYQFIYPGCGYGGSCFPKDVRALASIAREAGFGADLMQAVERVNDAQKDVMFQKLSQAFDGNLEGRTIALWGLAFKPNTDDMREAPSRRLMEALWGAGASVRAFDPEAMPEARRLYGGRADLVLASSPQQAAAGADALAICTEWKQFRVADFAWLKANLINPVIVDGRNLYDPEQVRQHGLLYYAIGRGDSVNRAASAPARREVA